MYYGVAVERNNSARFKTDSDKDEAVTLAYSLLELSVDGRLIEIGAEPLVSQRSQVEPA